MIPTACMYTHPKQSLPVRYLDWVAASCSYWCPRWSCILNICTGWCFCHHLAQILHLHSWWSSPETCTSDVFLFCFFHILYPNWPIYADLQMHMYITIVWYGCAVQLALCGSGCCTCGGGDGGPVVVVPGGRFRDGHFFAWQDVQTIDVYVQTSQAAGPLAIYSSTLTTSGSWRPEIT